MMEVPRLRFCGASAVRPLVIFVSGKLQSTQSSPLPGSRLIRLIPVPTTLVTKEDRELQAIYNLMAHRFPADVSEKIVRNIWEEVVEGRGDLWNGIGEDKKECIRGELLPW